MEFHTDPASPDLVRHLYILIFILELGAEFQWEVVVGIILKLLVILGWFQFLGTRACSLPFLELLVSR